MSILPKPGEFTNVSGIIADLRAIPQWILWKPILRGNKLTKVPLHWADPFGDSVNPHISQYWGTFDQVYAAMVADNAGRFGIGIVLDGTGIICIDLDDHVGADQEAVKRGQQYIEHLLTETNGTYAETSLQGAGRHVFIKAILPHGRQSGDINHLNIEVYAAGFIAVTGKSLSAWPQSIAYGQGIVDAWKLPPPVTNTGSIEKTEALGRRLDLTDRQVIETLMVRRPASFNVLATEGDLVERSDAFADLIGDLDKITGDPAQVDRIIRKAPVLKSTYNSSRYERRTYSFEHWLRLARTSNTASIPYAEIITGERRAFLVSIAEDISRRTNSAKIADATRTIDDLSPTPSSEVSKASDYLVRDDANNPIGYDYPHPHDPWAMFDPPNLPRNLLPQVIEHFSFGRADIMGCDESGLAMSALTVCAAAVTDRIKLKMKRHDDWHESARMWVSLVGDPSIKKSPIINAASQPLDAIERTFRKQYEEQVKTYEALDAETKKTTAPPIWKRRIVEDTTIEALQNVLHENPECILCRRDELSSWFGSMDRYSGGGKGASADRGFWLQGYNGGSYVLDRIGRGNKHLEYLSVNILGGIQPSVLQKIYKDTEDDGTMQRLFPIVLRSGGVGNDAPDDGSANRYRAVVSSLFHLTGADIQNGLITGATLTFDDGAQRVFREVQEWVHKLEALEAINKKLATAIGKWNGVFGRLALLFHLIDACSVSYVGEGPRSITNRISEQTALRVWDFMRVFLLQHLLAFHKNVMGTSDMQDDVEAVAEFLLSCQKAKVTIRDVQRGVQRKDSTHETLIKAMEQLEQYGWVDRVEGGRRDSLAWFVNAECHRKFAAKAQAVIAKREAARAAIIEATAIRREEKTNLGSA